MARRLVGVRSTLTLGCEVGCPTEGIGKHWLQSSVETPEPPSTLDICPVARGVAWENRFAVLP